MTKFETIKSLVASLEVDAGKFYGSNNAAAGTRLRKGLQQIKVLAQEIRNEVTEIKSAK
jgi:hypothetical protein